MEDTVEKKGRSYWPGIPQEKLSPENRIHIDILCTALGTGPWNISVNWDAVEWGRPWTFFNLSMTTLATADNDYLTRLVFEAHDKCVRVQVAPKTFNHIEVGMHSGRTREGSSMSSHKTLEQAVAEWREDHPTVPAEQPVSEKIMHRFRFYVPGDDGRPIEWPPVGPFWTTGMTETHQVVVAYAPDLETLTSSGHWPDAENIDDMGEQPIRFSDRFRKPDWWDEVEKERAGR